MAANSRFAVAVHILTALAYHGARGAAWTSSTQLAESVQTNPVVVRRVAAALGRAGLVESQPGRAGGARLARAPSAISLADVYRAVTQPAARAAGRADAADAGGAAGEGDGGVLGHNLNPPNRTCAVSRAMRGALAPVFAEVDDAVLDALGRRTLADVLGRIDPLRVDPRQGEPAPAAAPPRGRARAVVRR